MPSNPDPPPVPTPSQERPALIGLPGDGVGFLDAPGLDAAALFDTVDGVLAGMPAGAVLTVYSDDPAAAAAAGEWSAGRGRELLAIIRHERCGTTLTVRRADPLA